MPLRTAAGLLALIVALAGAAWTARADLARSTAPGACPAAEPSDLPLPPPPATSPLHRPDDLGRFAYDSLVYDFLSTRRYDTELGWCVDVGVRDTGPWIDGAYHGTHPAVRIYYSPEVMTWLEGGRQGTLQDGAVIVKEMFPPPAARYEGWSDAELAAHPGMMWAVMIKRADASADGWYWTGGSQGSPPERAGLEHFPPESGFGSYCLRCHASAETEATFSSLANVRGYPGEPLRFRVDDSWRNVDPAEKPWNDPHAFDGDDQEPTAGPTPLRNATFVRFFDSIAGITEPDSSTVQRFPGEVHDEVVAEAAGPQEFLTSDQCMGCHAGLSGPPGPDMFLVTGPTVDFVTPGFNVSPYGEWRRSPMGLGGRDPIFFAQLESEISILEREFGDRPALLDSLASTLVDTCLSCHGVMGQRQHRLDAGDDALFDRDWIFADPDGLTADQRRWAGLARDGISCAACHRQAAGVVPDDYDGSDLRYFLEHRSTGRFATGPSDRLIGPFREVVGHPMREALGIDPVPDPFVESSRLCGSCHTINLPNVDTPVAADPTVLDSMAMSPLFEPYNHSIEQATYLEWLNSDYQNEFDPDNPEARTCQDCHMPSRFETRDDRLTIDTLRTRIAAIQDETYPMAEHAAPADSLTVRFRDEGYARHELVGANAFMMSMFQQFPDILGVAGSDYMTGSTRDQQAAIDNLVIEATRWTATLEVASITTTPAAGGEGGGGTLGVDVKVANLTGHKLPSGVGFRRAFLEFVVRDTVNDRTIFQSGRTNELGVIVDGNGAVLPTEFFDRDAAGAQQWQEHHDTIRAEDQVQIYEELNANAEGDITTSFIHRNRHLKDNRLLAKGWSPRGPDPARYEELAPFLEATNPEGRATFDPEYEGGTGADVIHYRVTVPAGVPVENLRVEVRLLSQAIPPYYLMQRFSEAPDGPATHRLFWLASRLNVSGTAIEDWVLEMASVHRAVGRVRSAP